MSTGDTDAETAEVSATSTASTESTADDGLLATAVGVVVAPALTLRHVTAAPRVGWALVVALVVMVLPSVAGAAGMQPAAGGPGGAAETLAVVGAVVGPLLQLGGLALSAVVVWGVARLLGGRGDYRATFCGLAFALVPWALTVPLPLLGAAAGFPGRVLDGALTAAITVWVVVLAVLAVQAAHHLPTGRAVAATAAPAIAGMAAVGAVMALVAAAAILLGAAAFG